MHIGQKLLRGWRRLKGQEETEAYNFLFTLTIWHTHLVQPSAQNHDYHETNL